jgi:hypothetical protein
VALDKLLPEAPLCMPGVRKERRLPRDEIELTFT